MSHHTPSFDSFWLTHQRKDESNKEKKKKKSLFSPSSPPPKKNQILLEKEETKRFSNSFETYNFFFKQTFWIAVRLHSNVWPKKKKKKNGKNVKGKRERSGWKALKSIEFYSLKKILNYKKKKKKERRTTRKKKRIKKKKKRRKWKTHKGHFWKGKMKIFEENNRKKRKRVSKGKGCEWGGGGTEHGKHFLRVSFRGLKEKDGLKPFTINSYLS